MGDTYCVYKHTNSINGKVYIGITMNQPEIRWGRNGSGYSRQQFGHAISKYGWENFSHEILYKNLSQEQAFQKEIELISLYDSTNPQKGYNLAKGGADVVPILYKKTIYQYTLEGKFVKEYESSVDVVRQNGFKNNSAICHCCNNGINHQSYGYRWSYEYLGDEVAWELMRNNNFYQEVFCYNLDGNFIKRYPTVTSASEDTGINTGFISACYRGKFTNTKTFRWFKNFQGNKITPLEYKVDSNGTIHRAEKNIPKKKVYQYDLFGNYIQEYDSAKEVQSAYGYTISKIRRRCSQNKSLGDFYWSYKKYKNILKEELL